LKTSPAGIAAIAQREGERLTAYRDSRGLWTIGVGHLTNAFFKVFPGLKITREKEMELLAHDLGEVEATINRCVKVPMTQNQFDALASLGYNIGCGGLAGSSVVRYLNAKNYNAAADAFMAWCHPSVLIGRRKAERIQFLRK